MLPGSVTTETQADALRPGDALLRGQYRIEGYIGAGGFGITYLARNSLDRRVVVKECYPSAICCRGASGVQVRTVSMETDFAKVVRHFGREARQLAALDHPNIVRVHEVFEENQTAYMVLDFVEGRDLLSLIQDQRIAFRPEDVKAMLTTLLEAVSYIHENGILHRDISPDNILIDRAGTPILIDFGAAKDVAKSATRAVSAMEVVKDGYSPQEYYLSGSKQVEASDLYSLAATVYHLITGAEPPNSQVRLAALAAEEPDPYEPISPYTKDFDHYFIEAVNRALAVFPKHRLQSATEWLELIDAPRRQHALQQLAGRDQALLHSIRQLIEETNRAIAAQVEAEQREAAQRTATPPEPPKPKRPKYLDFFFEDEPEEEDDVAEEEVAESDVEDDLEQTETPEAEDELEDIEPQEPVPALALADRDLPPSAEGPVSAPVLDFNTTVPPQKSLVTRVVTAPLGILRQRSSAD